MRPALLLVVLVVALLSVPGSFAASTRMARIEISGGDLADPIEISDPKIVNLFHAFAGPGNSKGIGASSVPFYQPQCFIADWDLGPTSAPLSSTRPSNVYEIRFVVEFLLPRDADRIYIARYVINSVTDHGYVLIPGKDDAAYKDNVRSLKRGVEGQWFHAWDEWEKIAHPLIEKAAKKP